MISDQAGAVERKSQNNFSIVKIACWVRYKNQRCGGERSKVSRDLGKSMCREPRKKGQNFKEVFSSGVASTPYQYIHFEDMWWGVVFTTFNNGHGIGIYKAQRSPARRYQNGFTGVVGCTPCLLLAVSSGLLLIKVHFICTGRGRTQKKNEDKRNANTGVNRARLQLSSNWFWNNSRRPCPTTPPPPKYHVLPWSVWLSG